ncbi:MAG: hypothetical protein KBG63_05650 [Acetobacterium sp.]|nr:hypothetical protein [Acetobacterium sp.]
MRLGINLSVDVTKLEKSRFFKGKKGTYAKMTCFIDTEETSQFGDNGTITQELSKEDRDNGVKLPILGNAKIFWKDGQSGQQRKSRPQQQNNQNNGYDAENAEIPF